MSSSFRGILNSYGVFQTYYGQSFLHSQSASNISWIGSIQACLLFVVGALTGPIYDAGYMVPLLYVGTFLNILGLMMTSICKNYWQLALAQGVTIGIGDGCLFLTSVAIVPQYFTTRKAIATGIASLGSSIGGVIYPVIFRQLQPSIGFGWATRVMAFIALTTSITYIAGMRQKIPSHAKRGLVDMNALKELPFLYYNFGAFFGFMGIYVVFFYIQLYAIETVPNMSNSIATNLLSIINAGSVFGRLVPNLIADRLGPLNTQLPFVIVAAILAFCWIRIRDTTGLVIFCVLYGFFSGTFVSLQGPTVVSLCPDLSLVGTRIGMGLAFSGIGLLVGSPVAGAILRSEGGWAGLQSWGGAIILASALCMLAARIAKAGLGLQRV